MVIDEQMIFIVDELVRKYGLRCKVSRKEFYELLESRFGTNQGSIIPSDYCYNRSNKGIEFFKKPRLLFFLGDGMFECLGENYPLNGPVYSCPQGSKEEIEVGFWENGVFTKNKNWTLYGMK